MRLSLCFSFWFLAAACSAQVGTEVRSLLSTNRVWLSSVSSQEVSRVEAKADAALPKVATNGWTVAPHLAWWTPEAAFSALAASNYWHAGVSAITGATWVVGDSGAYGSSVIAGTELTQGWSAGPNGFGTWVSGIHEGVPVDSSVSLFSGILSFDETYGWDFHRSGASGSLLPASTDDLALATNGLLRADGNGSSLTGVLKVEVDTNALAQLASHSGVTNAHHLTAGTLSAIYNTVSGYDTFTSALDGDGTWGLSGGHIYSSIWMPDTDGAGNILYQVLPSAFVNDDAIEEVRLGQYVYTIGAHAFDGCDLFRFNFTPESMTSGLWWIQEHAFKDCVSMDVVHLRTGAESSNSLQIDDGAFSGCTALTDVYFYGPPPALGADVFVGTSATIHYQAGYDYGATFGGRPTAVFGPALLATNGDGSALTGITAPQVGAIPVTGGVASNLTVNEMLTLGGVPKSAWPIEYPTNYIAGFALPIPGTNMIYTLNVNSNGILELWGVTP